MLNCGDRTVKHASRAGSAVREDAEEAGVAGADADRAGFARDITLIEVPRRYDRAPMPKRSTQSRAASAALVLSSGRMRPTLAVSRSSAATDLAEAPRGLGCVRQLDGRADAVRRDDHAPF
jgi:hypothetical protein